MFKGSVVYLLDISRSTPLHVQLYEALKKDILTKLKTGDKLPSIRKMAQTYNISKTTVESAYSQLYAEGYIDSRAKSGYFVSEVEHLPFQTEPINHLPKTSSLNYRYDFFPARLSKDSFPLKLWKRLFVRAIDDSLDFGRYHDPQGELDLRYEIAKYLQESRAVKCTPDEIIVTGAFMDAMAMIADLLQGEKKHFAIESPGYHIAHKVFENAGYKIDKIPIDKNGLEIDKLMQTSAKSVYITPSHQYPTGVTMPVANRLKLLAWAHENDSFIIEDDYDSEMTYRSRPVPSLQGLDLHDRVIYIGTFSKSLSPALRIGYVVLPQRLMNKYREFHAFFPRVALMMQKTLELFMREGHWERHLRRVRNQNRKKHDIMKQALLKYLGNSFEIVSEGVGLAINIRPTQKINLECLEQQALKNSIKLYFASRTSGGEWDAIRMGFGGFDESEIEPAVIAFVKVWEKCLD